MSNFIYLTLLLLTFINNGFGAADYEVERVESPYVERRDIGPMMASGHSRHGGQRMSTVPRRSHSTYERQSQRCSTCQHGPGSSSSYGTGGLSSGSSSYSSSSYSYGGVNPTFTQPLQSSSRHEVKKEQKFLNGQQMYDFHHEKNYEDGQLIKENRYEKTPEEFGFHNNPAETSEYASSYKLGSSMASSSNSAGTSQPSGYNVLPHSSYHEKNQYQGGTQAGGYGFEPNVDGFSDQFQSDFDRLREELRRKTLSFSHQPLESSPTYGSSHRTEFRTETKYVNGKPVYVRNEERKYKDGKLVHDVTEEKGPEDLGTSDTAISSPVLISPTGDAHSSHREEVRSQSHIPSSRHPARYPNPYPHYYSSEFSNTNNAETGYRPSTYGSSSEISSSLSTYPSSVSTHLVDTQNAGSSISSSSNIHSSVSSQQRPYYKPSAVYSSENVEERKETPTPPGYHPNTYHGSYDKDDDDFDKPYRQPYIPISYGTSYHRPEASSYYTTTPTTTTTTTTTTATTPRSRYNPYDYSSTYDRDSQSPTYNQRQHERTQYNRESTRSYYPHNRPVDNTQRPPYYNYGGGRDSYTEVQNNTYEGTQRQSYNRNSYDRSESKPTTETSNIDSRPEDYSRSRYNTNTYPADKIRETSRPPYYDSRPNNDHPVDHSPSYGSTRNQVQVVTQERTSRTPGYRPSVHATSYGRSEETERKYQIPSQESRLTETSSRYQPGTRTATTQEKRTHRVSSEYYPNTYDSQRTGPYSSDRDDNDNDLARSSGAPTSKIGVPGFISGPEFDHGTDDDDDEQERYDISPYDDASEVDEVENEINTNRIRFENYPSRDTGRDSPYDSSQSHLYEESNRRSEEQSTHHGYQPRRLPQPDRLNAQREYSVLNSSRTDQTLRTVIPSRWIITKTTWKYINGQLASETQHHKYFENGIQVHENTTERTRDQMEADGVNVLSLDLTSSELAQYGGPTFTSNTHSQKHEVYQVKRFRDGHPVYELNHERLFQDGKLVHENREENDEDDLGELSATNHHLTQSQQTDHHSITGSTGLRTDGSYRTVLTTNPKSYVRKHELRQEEEFINGQKVYDLHHEREYEDGKLVRENKTELGPDDLGSHNVEHRDALKELLSGRTDSSATQNALLEQQRTSDSVLRTSCVTCGVAHGDTTHTSEKVLSSLGLPSDHGYNSGSTFRHDVNVEEHYENGQLVKGKANTQKWVDGQLVDSKTKHYYDGPSRTNADTILSEHTSSAAMSSAPVGRVAKTGRHNEECSYNPCQNRGTCKPSGGEPVCICPFGFRGTYCEEAYCPKRYCRYGGSCSLADGKHVCDCREGYSGYRCSTKLQSISLGISG